MSSTVRACLWMIGAIASFTSMAVAGREVSFELDTFEIMLFRSLIGFAIVVGILTVTDRLKDVQFRKLDLHITRNIAFIHDSKIKHWHPRPAGKGLNARYLHWKVMIGSVMVALYHTCINTLNVKCFKALLYQFDPVTDKYPSLPSFDRLFKDVSGCNCFSD